MEETVVAGVTHSRGQKDDRRDAFGLAEKLRTGTLDKRIFKAPRQFALLREFARTHQTIGPRSGPPAGAPQEPYRSRGVATPWRGVYGRAHREAWQEQLPASARTTASRLYEQIDFLVALKERAEQDLIRESRRHSIARLLETTPGMGPIRVARLPPIVVTPHRFRTRQPFWSYEPMEEGGALPTAPRQNAGNRR